MNYQTFQSHSDLESIIKCYWTLEVPADPNVQRQRIIPDGCMELIFILGDDIKRFTSNDKFIIQPRAMVVGQITEPFYIEPTGYVNTFGVRFYPYGFANFVTTPIKEMADKETPISTLFEKEVVTELEQAIITAASTEKRIEIVERFLSNRLNSKATIDSIVKDTIDSLLSTNGTMSISTILKDDLSKRRQLERNFSRQIGMSPKQLSKVIRLQTALKMLLSQQPDKLTKVAYDSEYYDQSHFIKDFKEFTGISPREFLGDDQMALSSLFYSKE